MAQNPNCAATCQDDSYSILIPKELLLPYLKKCQWYLMEYGPPETSVHNAI